jgi:hypothetical protein
MKPMTPHRVRGSLKTLSAVIGAGVVVTMGAVTFAHAGEDGVSTASTNVLPQTLTSTTAPTELATPFASPTYTATPCPKRATMPC